MINENIKGVRVCEKAFLTLKEASEYFNGGNRKASAHYFVDDKRIGLAT